MSQAELADALNIKQTTLSNYERCRNEPNFETLKAICSHFGVKTEWFMYGTGPMRTDEPPLTLETPQNIDGMQTNSTNSCTHSAKLERVEEERRELSEENRRLWKENGDLRERCARLEERQVRCNSVRGIDSAYFESA